MALSPIFRTPTVQPGILGLDRRQQQVQGVSDLLTSLGIGLMGNGPSTTPQSPLQGLGQGLAMNGQMAQQRQAQESNTLRDQIAQGQYGMEQQKFSADQEYQKARDAQLEDLIKTLPPEQQTAARADKETFFKAYAEHLFAKPEAQPGSVQEYEYAKSQGFKGSLLDYQKQKAEAGRTPQQPPQDPSDIQEYKFAVGQGFKGSYMDYLASKKGQGMSVTLPDGTVMQVGGSVKPPNESQMAAATRAQLIQTGLDGLDKLYNDPNINAWRMAGADTLAQSGPMGVVAGSKLKSDSEQQYAAAKASALEGLASAVTGAGVTTDQFTRYTTMLPDVTDKPEARKAKLKAANDFLRVLLKNSGSAGQAVLENLGKATPAAAPAPAASPPPATTTHDQLKPEDGWTQ